MICFHLHFRKIQLSQHQRLYFDVAEVTKPKVSDRLAGAK